MPLRVVGIGRQFAHHYQVKGDDWSIEVLEPSDLTEEVCPDVAIIANEVFPEYRNCISFFRERNIPTIYAIDGILEWRHSWDFPPSDACGQTFRPVLADKIACIGRNQARILESWGNVGKCEVVGVPRFDRLARVCQSERNRSSETARILVMTAKNPGFDQAQLDRTEKSLTQLHEWFQTNPVLNGKSIKPVWRLTVGMDEKIGVQGSASDTTGKQLADVLNAVDAVITTPSTAMLEAMRVGLPVALLDYHNCPHFVPAAWTISANSHFNQVIPELVNPPEPKMLWQDSILHDSLEHRGLASTRYVRLVETMAQIGRQCRAEGKPLEYPARILTDPDSGFHPVEERFNLSQLFPTKQSFQERDLRELQVANAHLSQLVEVRDAEIERLKTIVSTPTPIKDKSLKARWKRLRTKLSKKMQALRKVEAAA